MCVCEYVRRAARAGSRCLYVIRVRDTCALGCLAKGARMDFVYLSLCSVVEM